MPMFRKLKKNKLLLPLLIVLLAALLAGLLLQIAGRAPVRRLIERLGLRGETVSSSYFFPEGTGELFALVGDDLAVTSGTVIQLLAPSGSTLCAETVSMEQPALAASEELAAFYDVGARGVHILRPDGSSAFLDTEDAVLFVDADDQGRLAVVTRYPDYRGRVTVYGPSLTPLFAYDSGQSGYPLCARLGGKKSLAVCCVSESGSVLRLFEIDRETELGSYTGDGELIWDAEFLSDGTLAAMTEDALLLFNERMEPRGRRDFGDGYPADYCLTGDFAAVVLHRNRSGDAGELITVDSRGDTLGALELERGVTGLSCCGARLLVQYADELTLYDGELADDVSYQRVDNVLRALLRPDGSALLLSRYGVNLLWFD